MVSMTELTLDQALDHGAALHAAGDHEGATGLFRGVLLHEPQHFEAIERLGASLFERKLYHEALFWFWRGKKLDRRHPMALTNYGLCLSQLGHPDEGLPDLERAAYQAEKLGTSNDVKALVYNNLGNSLERIGRYPEALAALEKGIRFNPQHAFAYYNRGIVLLRLNRQHEAIDSLNRALELNPSDHDARYNRGMGRLLLGDLKNGFADYESRLLTTENDKPNLGMPADRKLWPGVSIEGKTILVLCEQGLGDDIQFFRFLPLLKDRNPREIQIVAHKASKPLLDGMPVTIRDEGEEIGPYDHWVALMSLPYILGIDETNLPPPQKLEIDAAWIAQWKWPEKNLQVGVCWAGNWRHKNDSHRSIPLEEFARVFDTPGCDFVSLQQLRPGEVEAFAKLQSERPNLKAYAFSDFRDTAGAILNLDVVLTVDTAVAHLAATLGVPTKILVPAFSTDWRWRLNRTDSPWYPSAELYRQPRIGDWDTPLDRACDFLADAARHKAA